MNQAVTISALATKAVLYEVACFPSPGLVSPISKGAHTDMDYFTFLDSTAALSPFFYEFTQSALRAGCPKTLFKDIRHQGIEAEKHMFEATLGINTHKGMLFLMGIACAATAFALKERLGFDDIPSVIMAMTEGIVEKELESQSLVTGRLSHGEMLYKNQKVSGIRGEVEKGMPTVFQIGLPHYANSHKLSKNHRLLHTLMAIVAECEDTTILHRHDRKVLETVQKKAKAFMAEGGLFNPEGLSALEAINTYFISKNISPGGSADLLGVSVFFHEVKQLF